MKRRVEREDKKRRETSFALVIVARKIYISNGYAKSQSAASTRIVIFFFAGCETRRERDERGAAVRRVKIGMFRASCCCGWVREKWERD